MRVFWFTPQPFPESALDMGLEMPISGGWIDSLGHALIKSNTVELAVATVVENPGWWKKNIDGVTHYTIPFPKGGYSEITLRPSTMLLENCRKAVEDFSPDIVHIHGTEYFYGLLALENIIKCPTVISTQGFVGECARVYFGGLSFKDVIRCQSWYGITKSSGILFDKMAFEKRARHMEDRIIKENRNFIGRTEWDRNYIIALNPGARYYHCNEILRPPFYSASWDLDRIDRYAIFASSASCPLKGFHWLIKAAAILHKEFPEIKIKISYPLYDKMVKERNYTSYLCDLIESLGLKDNIIPLGFLRAEQMAYELSKAHAFVVPSIIENSSNSLAEAMIVGTPSAASFAGGMPSMFSDFENALGFPPGGSSALAERLRLIFRDEELAVRLSRSAQATAQKRHNRTEIVKTTIQIYEDVIRSEMLNDASS